MRKIFAKDKTPDEQTPDEQTPAATPFPLTALPPAVRDYVEGVARVTQTPAQLAGCCALGIASASIGAAVEVQSLPDCTTRANLFIMAGARSGTGKTRCFSKIAKPFRDCGKQIVNQWLRDDYHKLMTRKRRLESEIKALANAKKKKEGGPSVEQTDSIAANKSSELADVEALLRCRPVFVTEDVTPEKLAAQLENRDETIASLSPDAKAAMHTMRGKYRRDGQAEDTIYVKGYSGDSHIQDRVMGATAVLERPCLTLLWVTQSERLREMLADGTLAGGGLLPRMLICETHTQAQKGYRGAGIDPAICAAWEKLIHSILDMRMNAPSGGYVIASTAEAFERLTEYHDSFVPARNGEHRDIDDYTARWGEQAWRLALVLHVMDHPENPNVALSGETAARGIELAEWFRLEQLALLDGQRLAARESLEQGVLELLAKHPNGITGRDVQRRLTISADSAQPLLAALVEVGKLAVEERKPKGGGHTVTLYTLARH